MEYRRLVVVTVVVLAGCNGLGLTGTESRQTATLTPVPLSPVERTAVPSDEMPPGVFRNGSVDVERLERAHRRALDNRSYVWTFRDNRTYPNLRNESYWYMKRVAVDGSTGLIETNESGGYGEQSWIANGTGYKRTMAQTDSRVSALPDPKAPSEHVFTGQMFELFLSNVDVNVTRVSRGGNTLFRLRATPPGSFVLGENHDSFVWSVRLTAYVTPSGFVETFAVAYHHRSSSWRQYVTLRYDYSAVGETSVQRPTWANGTRTPGETQNGTATPGQSPTP